MNDLCTQHKYHCVGNSFDMNYLKKIAEKGSNLLSFRVGYADAINIKYIKISNLSVIKL